MESLRKYFLHGAAGLIFGQAIGFFIPVLIIISIPLIYLSTLGDKFTGVIPPLIGFFPFLTSTIILSGLICIGLYYILGSSDANKSSFKNIFTKLGKIVSVIWILFMFVFALGASHDAGYFIKKVNEPDFFVVVDAGEINRFTYFSRAIDDIENGRMTEYSGAVPREEWNAVRGLIDDQKKCHSKGTSGDCFVKINDSFYQISFWTA